MQIIWSSKHEPIILISHTKILQNIKICTRNSEETSIRQTEDHLNTQEYHKVDHNA